MSIVLQNAAMLIWGKQYVTFPPIFPLLRYELAGAVISNMQVAIMALSCALMVGLLLLVHRTRLGRAMRATAQSPDTAALMGINPNVIISITFVIGAALAAVAGVMVGAYYGLAHYYMGFLLGLKAFTAAVLGGIGNIAGAMVGGLLLGVIESLGAGYIGDLTFGFLGSHYQDVFAFFVLILVLTLRPSGLLGERIGERA
jgi:branched-chain amino acid transport system permease protein